jgi:hypothetical protein
MPRQLKVYKVIPPADCSPQIGNLILLLGVARQRILDVVSNLSLAELDYAINKRTPTVGALMKHLIAMGTLIQLMTFERRGLTSAERKFWKDALPDPGQLLQGTISGHDMGYYKKLWKNVRGRTIKRVETKT